MSSDAAGASILVADDNENNREMLARRLRRQQMQVTLAEHGLEALELLRTRPFDLLLLDIMMPEMNGYEVLAAIKSDPALRHIPVIVISAINDTESVVRCIELGAEDYLPKPFDPILLKARVGACLEKKRLRDQEQYYLQQIEIERERSDRLLRNILPEEIALRLKESNQVIADSFADVTVLFADIVGFTDLSARISARQLVDLLNEIFSRFDELADQHLLEKIKTIGDSYMVVGGLPLPRADHAEAIAEMALAMQRALDQINSPSGEPIELRIGIHTGPVIAGVIGTRKFIYDLWGDTVNTASRLESHGLPGAIQVSETTFDRLRSRYRFEPRGEIVLKGKGPLTAYLLLGRIPDSAAAHTIR